MKLPYEEYQDEKESMKTGERLFTLVLFAISALLAIWLVSIMVSVATAQETPEMPVVVEQPKPFEGCEAATCSPLRDAWCYDWCTMETVSKADVRHYDGQLWVKHWQACSVNLQAWIDYAELLQQQVEEQKKRWVEYTNAIKQEVLKCKKWGK